jgi:hypothetical protein
MGERAHILGTFKGAGVFTVNLAQRAAHLFDHLIFVLFHPSLNSRAQPCADGQCHFAAALKPSSSFAPDRMSFAASCRNEPPRCGEIRTHTPVQNGDQRSGSRSDCDELSSTLGRTSASEVNVGLIKAVEQHQAVRPGHVQLIGYIATLLK